MKIDFSPSTPVTPKASIRLFVNLNGTRSGVSRVFPLTRGQ